MDESEKFIGVLEKSRQGVVQDLHALITKVDKRLSCKIIWSQLTYGLDNDFHYWVCAISNSKSCVKLHFHYGALLDDASFPETGNKFLRSLVIDPNKPLDIDLLSKLIRQAIAKKPLFVATWQNK